MRASRANPTLQLGDVRLSLGVSIAPAFITHLASCPQVDPVGCAKQPIPDHRHNVGITFITLPLTATFGLGKGFSVQLSLPLIAKLRTRSYEKLDKSPYTPPYGDLHHTQTPLSGLGDPSIILQWNAYFRSSWNLGISGGFSFPLGATTQDPEPLAAQSIEHEHMQIGSGTIDPRLALWGSWAHQKVGIFGRISLQQPLYANDQGYQGGRQVTLTLGPGYRLTQRLLWFTQLALNSSAEERWNGQVNEVSARDSLGLILGGNIQLSNHLRLSPVVQLEMASRSVGGSFKQPFIATMIFTYSNKTMPSFRKKL